MNDVMMMMILAVAAAHVTWLQLDLNTDMESKQSFKSSEF